MRRLGRPSPAPDGVPLIVGGLIVAAAGSSGSAPRHCLGAASASVAPGRHGNDQYDRMCRMNREATQELS